MINYSAWQWLLIDVANQRGFDKLTFEQRIQWTTDCLNELEARAIDVPTKTLPLYLKAVMAIRKAQQGIPTGHMVAVDSICSGIQIMSALTGCVSGATATGLVNPNVRADAYTEVTKAMQAILGHSVTISREDAKASVMKSFYGSKAVPKELFGEDTPELNAFYKAAHQVAPGAWELLQDLLASWQPYTLNHEWKLPDGFDVKVKVMAKREARIEVDELNHATFSYEFYENEDTKKGLSNVANMIHSVDAYILRCMHRRCNYDLEMITDRASLIDIELIQRSMGYCQESLIPNAKVLYYCQQYYRSTLADIVILPYLNVDSVQRLTTEHLRSLAKIIEGMLQYKPFDLVSVHDSFGSLAGNVNWVRWQYKEILAEIADSNVLDDLLSQINGKKGTFKKLSTSLGTLIRGSNYALC